MADFSIPLQSDAEKMGDYWVQKNRKAGEDLKKVDPKQIASLDDLYKANDEARAKAKEEEEAATQQRPYQFTGRGMRLPPNHPKVLEEKRRLLQGE